MPPADVFHGFVIVVYISDRDESEQEAAGGLWLLAWGKPPAVKHLRDKRIVVEFPASGNLWNYPGGWSSMTIPPITSLSVALQVPCGGRGALWRACHYHSFHILADIDRERWKEINASLRLVLKVCQELFSAEDRLFFSLSLFISVSLCVSLYICPLASP